MKVARTVLRGGKIERSYLSQQKVAGSNPATLKRWHIYSVKCWYRPSFFFTLKKGLFFDREGIPGRDTRKLPLFITLKKKRQKYVSFHPFSSLFFFLKKKRAEKGKVYLFYYYF